MVMTSLRKGASGGIGKFILFGFLVLAVAGLALSDIGGFFRTGTGSNNVLKVAGQTVSIQQFDRELRRNLSQIGLSPQDAYKLGYLDQVIGSNIRQILMKKVAHQSGINISRDRVADHIHDLLLPMTDSGQSVQDVLRQILRNQGMTEKELAAAIAYEIKNELVTNAIFASSPTANTLLVDNLYQFQNESRAVEYIRFHDSEIKVDAPDDTILEEQYEQTKAMYRIPETRNIQLVVIDDKDLRDDRSIEPEEFIERKYERADKLEDLLHQDITLDEIAKEVPVKILSVEQLTVSGQNNNSASLAAFSDNMAEFTQSAFSLEEGEFSPIIETTDGTLAVVKLEQINAESYHPYEKVKQQLESGYIKDAQHEQTQERAKAAFEKLSQDKDNLKAFATQESRTYRTAENLQRSGDHEPFNTQTLQKIFEAPVGDLFLTPIDGGMAIIRVTAFNTPALDEKARQSEEYIQMVRLFDQNMKSERLATLLESLNAKSPAKINNKLLERVYGQSDDFQ